MTASRLVHPPAGNNWRHSPPDRRHPAGDSLEKTSLPKCYNDDTYVRILIHWPKSGPYRDAEARQPNMKNAKQTAIRPCRRTQLLDTESRPKNLKMQYKWTGWVRAGLDLRKRDRVQNTKMQNKGPVRRAAGLRRLKRDCGQLAPAMTVRCNVGRMTKSMAGCERTLIPAMFRNTNLQSNSRMFNCKQR